MMVWNGKKSGWGRKSGRPVILAALLGACATGALAQVGSPQAPLKFRTDYLGYAANVSPRVTFTDNINLAPGDLADDEIILSTLFNGSAIFSNRRFTGLISGDLDFSYLTDDGDFRVNQDIGGASTATIADNWLYLDIAGQTSRQLIGDNARFSANRNAARDQQANVHSFAVSPYVYHQFPNQSTGELRYRFSQVFVDDTESAASSGVNDFLNDSQTHEALASYRSGALFDRLRFTLTAYGNITDEDGSALLPRIEYEQGSVTAEAQYALGRSIAVSAAVGYDEIETFATRTEDVNGVPTDVELDLFDDDLLSGFFWRAGFTARPGRRTQVRLEYGRRYDDDFIDADIRYDFSDRLRLIAGASRTFQTRAQSINRRFQSLQQRTLQFADRLRQGRDEEISPKALIDSITNVGQSQVNAQAVGIGTSNDAFVQLNGAFDRTTVNLTASYQDTDFGFRQNEIYGVTASASRELSRRMRAYGDVFWRNADTTVDQATCVDRPFLFGVNPAFSAQPVEVLCAQLAFFNGQTDTVGGRIGAAYQLYKNLSVFGEYSHSERFSQVDALEYSENTFTAGVTLDF